MVTFGDKLSENFLVCGVHQIVPAEYELKDHANLQFFITNKMDVYKRTEGYEPRGSSLGPPPESV